MELEETVVADEFGQLRGITYVDHAGATLYAKSQISKYFDDLTSKVYGNPHSNNDSSARTADAIHLVRQRLLRLLGTTSDKYSVIFTSGCTAALRLLAESFFPTSHGSSSDSSADFGGGRTSGCFCYLDDNHTSVIGMREVIVARQGSSALVKCVTPEEMRLMSSEVVASSTLCADRQQHRCEQQQLPPTAGSDVRALFAYPAQSNFSGRKYPLHWVKDVQQSLCLFQRDLGAALPRNWDVAEQQLQGWRWCVVLDAASFASTSPLNLDGIDADFVTLSFYKIFGFPTGIGALLVRNESASLLEKQYFGGGTIEMATVRDHFVHVFKKKLWERFEDGTLPFLDVIALQHGFDTVERLAGGMSSVSEHTFSLARRFCHELVSMRHCNGAAVAIVYCHGGTAEPNAIKGDIGDAFLSSATQGPIVNFNLLRSDGSFIGFVEVERLAQLYGIELRTGCFCNVGACQRHLGISTQQLRDHHRRGRRCGEAGHDLIDGRPTGSVRVSFGYMSTAADVECVVRFVRECFVGPASSLSTDAEQQLRQCSKPCHDRSVDPAVEIAVSVTLLFLYPIKSCGAMRVTSWETDSRGLKYDRHWMVVGESGACLTQKRLPQMCLVSPLVDCQRRLLVLSYPNFPSIELPIDSPTADVKKLGDADGETCVSKVCGDRVAGSDCGDGVAAWLSDVLCTPGCRLVRQEVCGSSTGSSRKAKANELQPSAVPTSAAVELSLANEAQYLLIASASVRRLSEDILSNCNEAISDEDLVGRLRPNIVVSSLMPYEEEQWQGLRPVSGATYTFQCTGTCSRCQMICIDQVTCEKTKEPLRTLTVSRSRKPTFGIYLSSNSYGCCISVGDQLIAEQRSSPVQIIPACP